MSKKQMSVWENFCKYGAEKIAEPAAEQEPEAEIAPVQKEQEAEPVIKDPEPVVESNKKFTLQKFTLEYTNTNDFSSIMSDLMMVAGGRHCAKIIISASFNDE